MAFPLLVREASAAALLSLRVSEVRRLAKSGQLPAKILPSGERRFDPAELAEWAAQLKREKADD
jgi:hypothetical protein